MPRPDKDSEIFRRIEQGDLRALRRLVEETATAVKQPLMPTPPPADSSDQPSAPAAA